MRDILILLRIELKRLFKSKLFYVSLFIGLPYLSGDLLSVRSRILILLTALMGEWKHIRSLYLIRGWECLWGLSLYLHLICIYLCCLQHFPIVDSSAEITRTSTFCNITAECQRIRFMLPDSLQHLSQEDL